MTDYRTVAETESDPMAPIVAALIKALAKNPLALFEGAPGAPRLQFAALGAWFSTHSNIGTYTFARRTLGAGENFSHGQLCNGSELQPTSAITSNATSNGQMTGDFGMGSPLSGTWRCMGRYDHAVNSNGGGAYLGATLWMRVA